MRQIETDWKGRELTAELGNANAIFTKSQYKHTTENKIKLANATFEVIYLMPTKVGKTEIDEEY